MTRRYAFRTVDVFTDTRFGGNQLAVFTDAAGLSDGEMQALAAEMNLSETSFVLPPDDPANDARVRIFNRTAEMPFAGHPNVGTAYVLAQLRPGKDRFRFEELAGLVEVRLDAAGGAEIDAPQPLSLLGEVSPAAIARALSLDESDVLTSAHKPVRASVGVEFVLAEVSEDALAGAAPDLAGFRHGMAQVASDADRFSIFFYCRPAAGPLRARMFAPLSGTWEDPATGSANATLAALLLSLSGDRELSYEAIQGVEMGRPSRLRLKAWRDESDIRASVGGRCVPVLEGFATL
ncbi:PhzF family phenazine biosynthesis protein [Sphingomonas sp. ID1715]|uniref:PhzF family phenazine biosynthesis protein n=1 Tax=Sphingomonas sp. ID1715 TaxID=1656898 RepID=UPI001487FD19|nr:PhzF family phenazine biosynthesis protein [Sphingomonas sp. ID1715]NNM78270.1 PhzF family phenazine biosynthesis protein [Sphingomonas sp. ID1715]